MAREKRPTGLYSIVRGYANTYTKRRIKTDLTLDEAKAHCKDPEASSRACTSSKGKARTARYGAWFDGFIAQYKTIK